MEKKVILVGMMTRYNAYTFAETVIESLRFEKVHITYIDRYRIKTEHTDVRFVFPVGDRIDGLIGLRADAIFGEPFTELLMRAKEGAVIAYRDKIGLVDYVCKVERESSESIRTLELGEAIHAGFTLGLKSDGEKRVTDTWIGEMWPPQMYISMPPRNGKSLYRHILNSVYGKNPDPTIQLQIYAALMKGENTMPTETERYVRHDITSLAEAFKRVNDAFNRPKFPGIKTVHFSGPCTVVIWEDKTKTIVRCKDGEMPDYEKGLAMAIAKKALGTNKSGSNYYDIFRKWLPKEEEQNG